MLLQASLEEQLRAMESSSQGRHELLEQKLRQELRGEIVAEITSNVTDLVRSTGEAQSRSVGLGLEALGSEMKAIASLAAEKLRADMRVDAATDTDLRTADGTTEMDATTHHDKATDTERATEEKATEILPTDFSDSNAPLQSVLSAGTVPSPIVSPLSSRPVSAAAVVALYNTSSNVHAQSMQNALMFAQQPQQLSVQHSQPSYSYPADGRDFSQSTSSQPQGLSGQPYLVTERNSAASSAQQPVQPVQPVGFTRDSFAAAESDVGFSFPQQSIQSNESPRRLYSTADANAPFAPQQMQLQDWFPAPSDRPAAVDSSRSTAPLLSSPSLLPPGDSLAAAETSRAILQQSFQSQGSQRQQFSPLEPRRTSPAQQNLETQGSMKKSSQQPIPSRGTIRQPFPSSETIPERPTVSETDRASFSQQPIPSRGTIRQPFPSDSVGQTSQSLRFPSAAAALGEPLPSLWDAAQQERRERQESSAVVEKVGASPSNRGTVSHPNPPSGPRASQFSRGVGNPSSPSPSPLPVAQQQASSDASSLSGLDDPTKAKVLALTAEIEKHEAEVNLAKKSVAQFIEQFNGKFGRRPSKVERKQYARDTFKAYHQVDTVVIVVLFPCMSNLELSRTAVSERQEVGRGEAAATNAGGQRAGRAGKAGRRGRRRGRRRGMTSMSQSMPTDGAGREGLFLFITL